MSADQPIPPSWPDAPGVEVRGQVVSGVGAAAGFTALEWVQRQLLARYGFRPYPGTLNLRLSSAADQAALAHLRAQPGQPLEPEPGFCAARCYVVLLDRRQPAVLVYPLVDGYPKDSLELLAPVRLRDRLALTDGSTVLVSFLDDGE